MLLWETESAVTKRAIAVLKAKAVYPKDGTRGSGR